MSRRRTIPICAESDFKTIVSDIRKVAQFPKRIKVVYTRLPTEECDGQKGWTEKDGRTFTIYVDREMSQSHMEEVLLHETGHVLDWRPYHLFTADHGPTFWIMYGELYCRYHATR